jgi:hypothetical protein
MYHLQWRLSGYELLSFVLIQEGLYFYINFKEYLFCSHQVLRGCCSHGLRGLGYILLELVADLGIIHVMLVLKTCRRQELWGHRGFHQILKESLEDQTMCSRSSVNSP